MDLALPLGAAGTRVSHGWRMRANFGGGQYAVAVGIGRPVVGRVRAALAHALRGAFRRAARAPPRQRLAGAPGRVRDGCRIVTMTARVAAGAPALRRGCSVVLAGWYGAANLGDELILSTFVAWVRDAGGLPCVISVHPAVHDLHARSRVGELHEPGRGRGGGRASGPRRARRRRAVPELRRVRPPSLDRFPARNVSQFAQFFLLATELGVPTAVLGQGVGPLRTADARGITADVFARADVCSVRDAESARLLRDIGVQRIVPIAPDPAWCYALPPAVDPAARFAQLAGQRVIAIVLRDWPFDGAWEDAFVVAFRDALPAGWACLWLDFARTPSEDPDVVAGGEIAYRLIPRLADGRVHVVWQGMHVDEAAGLIAGCDALVAMRLHAALLGHLASLPVVALEYDDKVRVLGDELQMPAQQRMSLAAIGEALRPALARACGEAGAASRLAAATREQLARSAGAQRDLLWQAMRRATQARSAIPVETPLLDRWVAAAPGAAARVLAALPAAGRRAPRPRLICGSAAGLRMRCGIRGDWRRSCGASARSHGAASSARC